MKVFSVAAISLLALSSAVAVQAQDFTPKEKGTFIVNARVTNVGPEESGDVKTAAGVDSGLDVKVNDDTIPSLGFTYFFTDHIAVEAILGTSKHEVRAVGGTTDAQVHSTWVLPPVVTAQYHFSPKARVSPYVGAGLNAMVFYNDKNFNGYEVELDNGIGYALQAGVDIAVRGNWQVNIDAKKVFFEADAKINGGDLKSKVTLDPWVVSVGAGYRF